MDPESASTSSCDAPCGEAPADVSQTRRRFADVARCPDTAIDLGEAAFLIAAEEYPGLDVSAGVARLDRLADDLRPRLDPLPPDADFERLQALLSYLFQELGFTGNRDGYYDPRNSYLNEILDRRLGIPISLSLLTIEIGRRVGVALEGVGFPGHFLLRHTRHREVVIDAFHGGAILAQGDCEALLQELSGGMIPYHPRLLQAVTRRQILARMLCNLKGIHLHRGATDKALAALDRILLLAPDDPHSTRERGVLLVQQGRLGEGLRDLERYLEIDPEAPDRAVLGPFVAAMRQVVAAN